MENEFHSRYDNLLPNDACWIWHGRSFNGHPVMRVANGFVYAHRVAYLELSNVTCTIPKEA
jgi:hypothetical protein